MAKKPKDEKPTETPFRRFAMLARKVVSAPKPEAESERKRTRKAS